MARKRAQAPTTREAAAQSSDEDPRSWWQEATAGAEGGTRTVYWLERLEAYLAEKTERTALRPEELEQRMSPETYVPPPAPSTTGVQRIIDRFREVGTHYLDHDPATGKSFFVRDIHRLRAEEGATHLSEIRTLTQTLRASFERVSTWAWQHEGLLPYDGAFYRPRETPEEWVLAALWLSPGPEDNALKTADGPHARRPYGTRVPPFTLEHAHVLSAPPVQAASEAMWAIGSNGEGALSRRENATPLVTTSNNVIISIGGSPTEVISSEEESTLWQAALALGDDTAATFWICMAKWFCETAGDMARASTRVHVADILSFRGFKKQVAGGYKTVQKQEARDDIRKLNDVWVKSVDVVHEGTGKARKPKTVYLESRLMEIAVETEDKDGQVPYAFRVRPGDWATPYLTEDNRETALLLRPILQYDARQGVERMAMRLGLYLTPQWRTRAAHRNYGQSFKVETLLTRTRLPIPTARQRYSEFRDHFEAALDRLQADRAIGTRDEAGHLLDGWRYDKGDDTTLPTYRWFDTWLQWTVLIPPPASVLQAYAAIGAHRAAVRRGGAPLRRRPSEARSPSVAP